MSEWRLGGMLLAASFAAVAIILKSPEYAVIAGVVLAFAV